MTKTLKAHRHTPIRELAQESRDPSGEWLSRIDVCRCGFRRRTLTSDSGLRAVSAWLSEEEIREHGYTSRRRPA